MIEGNQNLKPTLEAIGQEVEIGVVTSTVGQELTFYTSKKDTGKTGSSIFREDTHAFKDKFLELEVKVKTKTLDDILARRNLTGKITFLKLDIQGAEIEALKGATILLRNVDFILSEVSLFQYNVGAPSFAKTVYFMNKIGYVVSNSVNNLLYCLRGLIL